MSLVDTSDGLLMIGTYRWAFMNPARKLYYNLAITGISVVIAVLVGTIEALGLASEKLGLEGGLCLAAGWATAHFSALGYVVIGIFAASWLVSLVVYRAVNYHRISSLDHS